MRKLYGPIFLFISLINGACVAVNSQSFYEGIRTQQKASSSGAEPKQTILPSYQQYQQEREKLQ
jgi:hypothetical protein